MADEWATGDTFDAIKLNRKTRFVGTNTQATAFITSPQIGQMVYSTSSSADTDTFIADKMSFYNSSSAWVCPTIRSTSGTNTPVIDTTHTGEAVGRKYHYFTLPSTQKYYLITQMECKLRMTNGTTSLTMMGVDLVDASPPVQTNTPLVALTNQISYTNSAAENTFTMTSSYVSSNPVRGGTLLGAWVMVDTMAGNGQVRQAAASAGNRKKVIAYTSTPAMADNTSWGSDSTEAYILVTYLGYN